MFVDQREGKEKEILRFVPPTDFRSRVARTLRRQSLARGLNRYEKSRPTNGELFSDDRSPHGEAPLRQIPSCDILNLHWISGFLDSNSMFRQVPDRAHLVWTLHDMNAFTGGCHYNAGCEKHLSGCGSCPQLGSTQERDLSRQIWNRRLSAYSRLAPSKLRLVAPSRWMASEIQRSELLGRFPVSVIANGVDLDAFAPRNKAFARDTLGLPQEANVLLFAAHAVDERRKGFSALMAALGGLREDLNLHLVAVGRYSVSPDMGIPFRSLGYISNERLLSAVYSAADLCVVPTLQDNLPNIAIESLACGTPVVGFNVGGLPDIVDHGHTGLLVPVGNSQALRESIASALANPEALASMGVQCRRSAVEKYSIHRQALDYLTLYQNLDGLKKQ